jgi:hypothetical protein
MSGAGIAGTVAGWGAAINTAVNGNDPDGWDTIHPDAVENVRDVSSIDADCVDFLGWTVLALVELCRGSDTVRHSLPWTSVETAREFKIMSSPADDCQIIAGNLCVAAVENGVTGGELSAERIDNVLDDCPDGLPYAAPCAQVGTATAAAHECVKARIRTIIRVIEVP